jgi:hypothetical protein
MTAQLTTAFVLVSTLALGAQMTQHHANMAMGFDQDKTAHHFFLYTDGGAIDVSVKDTDDTKNRDAIRSHLPHIAHLFSEGDFKTPALVHQTNVPGTEAMAAHKAAITYAYKETPKGGRVEITTRDSDALKAVHEFLKFQIADHKTGDSLEIRKR